MKKSLLINTLLLLISIGSYAQIKAPENAMVEERCKIKIKASAADSTICLGSSDSLSANVIGGTAPFTYSWAPPTGLSCTNCPSPVATPTASTTYTVTVTDVNGCTATAKVHIKINKPPHFNADTLIDEALTNQPLSAIGGVPPYTYTFAPSISSSNIMTLLSTPATCTITVTGANGCSSTDTVSYIPISSTTSCGSIFISEYIQDTVHNDLGVELYNPTDSAIHLSNYYLFGTTNGSLFAPPFIIKLHGVIAAHRTFLIANSSADSTLTRKAKILTPLLNFGGLDIVALANIVINSPNVTGTLLDAVGAISPRPSDSGWVVGTGSTKNHTLVRQSYITAGDFNWATCQYQWNVYPRGTFNYIGHFKNACSTGDPDLFLTLENPVTICSGGSKNFEFDVYASANANTYFDNCLMRIQYNGVAFGDNVVSNGNVTITKGTYFNIPTYTDSAIDYSPDTLDIAFSTDTNESSLNRYYLGSTPEQLIHVKMKVQNCGANTEISFTDITFTYIFSLYNPTAYDSTQYDVSYDTTYYSGSLNEPACQSTNIRYFTNPISAGANAKSIPANSSILTIHGGSFGSTQGSIKVANADNGFDGKGAEDMIPLDSTDILTWVDDIITVKMPSVLSDSGFTPGSGPFTVYTTCGDAVTSHLQINYSILSVGSPHSEAKLTPHIVMVNPAESYIWRCDTSIGNNPKAKACVVKAIREWNCYTGVNWKLGADTALAITKRDGISDIYLDDTLSGGTVMETTSQYLTDTCYDPFDSVTFMDEADIKVNSNIANYSYDTIGIVYSPDSTYFYDAILHEMGHALGLGHINDTLSLMYWFTAAFRPSITSQGPFYPGPGTLEGGLDMVHTSVLPTNAPGLLSCGAFAILDTIPRGCFDPTLDVPVIPKNLYDLNLYPNPTNGELTIGYQLTTNSIIEFKITDCVGRVLIKLPEKQEGAGDYSEQLNVAVLAQGVYFFVANINGESTTIKFIKL